MKSKHNRADISAEQLVQLREAFVQALFAHQREWWGMRGHACRFIINPRQIGATWYFAIEGLIRAIETGDNQIFVSASKLQALASRDCIAEFVMRVIGLGLCGDPVRLPNGAELHFYGPGNLQHCLERAEDGAKLPQGHLYFDQPFWVRNFARVNHQAGAMAPQPRWNRTYFGAAERTEGSAAACDFWFEGLDGCEWEWIELRNGKQCADGIWRQALTAEDAVSGGFNLYDLQVMREAYTAEEFRRLYMCDGFVERGGAA